MPVFSYTATDDTGRKIQGSAEAETREELVTRLAQTGIKIQQIKETKGKMVQSKAKGSMFRRVGLRDLSIFCRQFSTMINAGVSLVRCLTVLESQTRNPNLKAIIADIREEIEGGATLSRSMGKYPRVFSTLFIGLIRAGEIGGVLDETMARLADFLESSMELRRKVKSAMTYPMVVLFVAAGIVIGLMTFIFPKFMQLFTDLEVGEDQMPTPTKILKATSDFILGKWYFAIAIAVIVGIGFMHLIRTKFGRKYFDLFKLKMPVFGKINQQLALSRFARTLSTLIESGVQILQAMETTAGAVQNVIFENAIMDARAGVREGEPIAGPLEASKMFPPMVIHMISIGEETGALDAMLEKIAEFYEAEVDAALESLAATIEPVMIVLLGGIVGFIVIAMFMPLISIIGNLSGGS